MSWNEMIGGPKRAGWSGFTGSRTAHLGARVLG